MHNWIDWDYHLIYLHKLYSLISYHSLSISSTRNSKLNTMFSTEYVGRNFIIVPLCNSPQKHSRHLLPDKPSLPGFFISILRRILCTFENSPTPQMTWKTNIVQRICQNAGVPRSSVPILRREADAVSYGDVLLDFDFPDGSLKAAAPLTKESPRFLLAGWKLYGTNESAA